MDKSGIPNIKKRIKAFLATRGIAEGDNTMKTKFYEDFVAYFISYTVEYDIPPDETLRLLEDPENLIDSSEFNTNFRKKFDDFISPNLMANPVFCELLTMALKCSGKGVGIGELLFPLIIKDYHYSTKGDGKCGNLITEVKNGKGASLKTTKDAGLRIIDLLVKKYFYGKAFGYTSKRAREEHYAVVKDITKGDDIKRKELYESFFTELYSHVDSKVIEKLSTDVAENHTDPEELGHIMGEFALVQYKSIDEYDILLIVSEEERTIVNIVDPTDIRALGLKFTFAKRRGGDTQAVGDGYVNVKIRKAR